MATKPAMLTPERKITRKSLNEVFGPALASEITHYAEETGVEVLSVTQEMADDFMECTAAVASRSTVL
jgi:hypothetical protein